MMGPSSSPLAHVPNTSSELRVDGVVARKKDLLYNRHWSHFLLTSYSRLRTHNQGCLWSSPKAKKQPSINLSIWKIDPYTLLPHNASMPDGTPAAAAVAKSLQSCPTLCDPIDHSPPGSPVPGILQARTLEWVAISFSNA